MQTMQKGHWGRVIPAVLLAGAAILSVNAGADAVQLPRYNIDLNQTSVSGLSSGAFMAVQFQVAYSSAIKGAGVLAGGPYNCAQGDLVKAQLNCMMALMPTGVASLVSTTKSRAQNGQIDPVSNLRNHRVWMFSGTLDSVVKPPVMNDLKSYYGNFVDPANVAYNNTIAAEHAMPTDEYGNSCATKGDPFINNCHLDAAGELLKHIYGNLREERTGTLGGSFVEFDQSEFIQSPNSHSMSDTGWVYVPAACAAGQQCKLHVVFHGCKQYPSYSFFAPGSGMQTYGTTYVKNTGYNGWADSNNIVMLYPQAYNGAGNPNGCWDWWGYDDPNYAVKSGNQMRAVKAMIDRVAPKPEHPPLAAPSNVTPTPHDNTVDLVWSAVPGAAGYNVFRDGSKVNANAVAATSYTDSGLQAKTEYGYVVSATDNRGVGGTPSAEIAVTTTAPGEAGGGGAQGQPAPANLSVAAAKPTYVSLTWNPASGAAGYDVYRALDGGSTAKVNARRINNNRYTVRGLQPGTAYGFTVRARYANGVSSGDSNQVTAQTAPTCFTSNNVEHIKARRAHAKGDVALANGSNSDLGFIRSDRATALKKVRANYYVIDFLTCP